MDTLPETILADIISYVGHTDLCSVRLVSRKFYRISLSSSIVSREKFAYNTRICDNGFSHCITALLQTGRKFYHFFFDHAYVTMEYFERLVLDRGWFIRSLEFRNCIIDDQVRFWRCLSQCENLKSLITLNSLNYLQDIDVTAISLASLEYLEIRPLRGGELSLDKFVKIAPNVRNFVIDNRSLYTFDGALFHITAKLNRIQIITLSGDFCRKEDLLKIADLSFSDLREINLDYNCFIDSDCLKYLVKKQRSLQVLRIKYNEVFDNELLLTVADCLKNLKTLDGGIPPEEKELVFDGLISVMSRTSVRQLRLWSTSVIEYVNLITATDEINADAGTPKYNLNELTLTHGVRLSCERLEYIARNFPALTNLNLAYSSVTNDGLRIICKYLRNLKILNLSGCIDISDDGFDTHPSFGESLGNLEELYLKDCPLISDTTVQNYLKLPYLRLLNLGNCKRLTANSFATLSDNCICLETLDMSTIKIDGELLLKTVCSLGRLRVLYIQACGGFTDDLLQSLYKCSNFLMEIRINYRFSFVRSWSNKKFESRSY